MADIGICLYILKIVNMNTKVNIIRIRIRIIIIIIIININMNITISVDCSKWCLGRMKHPRRSSTGKQAEGPPETQARVA